MYDNFKASRKLIQQKRQKRLNCENIAGEENVLPKENWLKPLLFVTEN